MAKRMRQKSLFSMLGAEKSSADREETKLNEPSEAVLMDSYEEILPESQVLTDKLTEGTNSSPAGESQSTDIIDTNQPASVDQGTLLDVLLCKSRALSNDEKYLLLTTNQVDHLGSSLDVRYFSIDGGRKRKQVMFQKRWLQEYPWLHYGLSEVHKGGWCIPCVLFLTDIEKSALGPFINSPFINYNKSKELCEKGVPFTCY